MKVHNLVVTGSLTSVGEDITRISSSVTTTITNLSSSLTSSMGGLSSSMVVMITDMSSSLTSSMGSLSSSMATSMTNLSSSMGGIMATTGSNLFVGTQTISGSIIPSVDSSYDLGSPTNNFRHLYLSSASLYIDGTKVLSSTTQELQITTDNGQSFKILEAGSDTITLQSNDGNITLATSGGGDVILDPTNGIIALKGSTQIYAGNRILSSDGNNIHFGNGVIISGSILATGTSLLSGSQQIGEFGYTTTSSVNTISSSFNTRINSIQGVQATTGSNNFQGNQTITGSLYISQNLIVQGSSSLQDITGSNVYIGTNKINLNTDSPAVRFGGISVFDSGSNFGVSGSLLWDSLNNHWLYQHPSNSIEGYNSAILIAGPKNTGALGQEATLTEGKIVLATGEDHIGDSIITQTNGDISVSGSLRITGSIVATGTSLVSGSSQILNGTGIWSGSAQLPSGVVSGSVQVDVMSTTNIARLATTGSNTFTGTQTINASNVGRINLGNTTGSTKTAGAIIAQTSPSYSATGKLGFSVTTWGVNTDYDLTEVMAIDMRSADTKGAIIYMNPFGGGRFGFGTQNPASIFHLSGSTNDIGVRMTNSTASRTYMSYVDISGNYIIQDATADSNRLTITTGGTATFASSISAGGSISAAGNVAITKEGSNDIGVGPYLAIAQPTQSKQWVFQLNGSAGLDFWHYNGTAWSVPLKVGTTGAVGINSYTSTIPLEIKRFVGSGGTLRLVGNDTVVGMPSLSFLNDNGNGGASISMTTLNQLNLNGTAYVNASGNLGVGYSDPQYTLQVLNTIGLRANSQNIKAITGTGWGYSPSTYKVVMLGDTTNNVTVSINYDPSGNSNGAFNGGGSEVLFRNGASFATPTSANTAFHLNTLVMKDGKIGVGTDAPAHAVDVNGNMRINQSVAYLYFTGTITNRYIAYNGADTYWRADGIHYFEKTSGYKGSWDANSNLTVNGTITESSALRYKENINPLENSLEKVSKLRGVSYVKKETGLKEFGFIAEEVNEIIPELVLRNPNGEIESVAYGRFVSILAEAIKELKTEIEVLKQNK